MNTYRTKFKWILTLCTAFWFCSSVATAGCLEDLRASESFNLLLDEAVDRVNTIVGIDELTLTRVNPTNPQVLPDNEIAVSSVNSYRANGVVAQVQPDCREILMSGLDFNDAFEKLAPPDSLVNGQEIQMLTFLLLHELGHIASGHSGEFFPSDGNALINLDATASKKREQEADDFVANVLSDHVAGIDEGSASTSALEIVILISSLSFELSGEDAIERFGCRVLGCQEVFWDHGRSHENLQYRLLRMSHQISPSETSESLLEDFERQRPERSTGGAWIILPNGERQYIESGSEEFELFEELLRTLPQPGLSDDTPQFSD